MIRVYYNHPNPAGGYFDAAHSMPVADMAQWNLRVAKFAAEYGLVGVRVTRTEEIDTRYENASADYYTKYGTVGEF